MYDNFPKGTKQTEAAGFHFFSRYNQNEERVQGIFMSTFWCFFFMFWVAAGFWYVAEWIHDRIQITGIPQLNFMKCAQPKREIKLGALIFRAHLKVLRPRVYKSAGVSEDLWFSRI